MDFSPLTRHACLILMVLTFRAILVQPGLVLTEMTKGLECPAEFVANLPKMAGFDAVATEAFAYNASLEPVQKIIGATQGPDEVANVIKEAALSEKPKLWYRTSEMVEQLAASKLVQTDGDSRYDFLSPKQ